MARYIDYTQLPSPPSADPQAELISSLTKITTGFPPQQQYGHHSCHGLYSGPTSIAYLFYTLSKSHHSLSISNKSLTHWTRAYLAGSRPKTEITSSRCGVANETLAHLAVSAAFTQQQSHVQDFLDDVPALLRKSHSASNEWLYGRAGTLYLLRLIRKTCSSSNKAAIDEAITAIIDKVLSEGPPWYWHGKDYLGAVHGSIGIITQIILSEPSRTPALTHLVEDLLDTQDPTTGNFPSSIDSAHPNKLIQFCHGAPGFLISLLAIKPHLPPSSPLHRHLTTAITNSRHSIRTHGLLRKLPSLCHGAVGNALALEPAERDVFMRWASAEMIEKGLDEGWYVEGDDEWGLFCGEAGRAWGWGVLVGQDGKGEGGMVGYSDL